VKKSADAFRTISEVAELLDVPKHVLRFWEGKFPQIKPMKRGGGRRYYRPADLELLRGIRALLHTEGYTIKGVQKILREQGVESAKSYAEDQLPTVTKQASRPQLKAELSNAERQSTGKKRAGAAKAEAHAQTSTLSNGEPIDLPSSVEGSPFSQHRLLLRKAVSQLEDCRALLTGALTHIETSKQPALRIKNRVAAR